jgi:hypothetical protein
MQYRYTLHRHVKSSAIKTSAFFGINPRTADNQVDEQTVKKCLGFVSRWEGKDFIVGNVFAFWSTDVKGLNTINDPVGPLNNGYIAAIIQHADVLVPCWADRKKLPRSLRQKCEAIMTALKVSKKPVYALRLTVDGDPAHPLMIPYNTKLIAL